MAWVLHASSSGTRLTSSQGQGLVFPAFFKLFEAVVLYDDFANLTQDERATLVSTAEYFEGLAKIPPANFGHMLSAAVHVVFGSRTLTTFSAGFGFAPKKLALGKPGSTPSLSTTKRFSQRRRQSLFTSQRA